MTATPVAAAEDFSTLPEEPHAQAVELVILERRRKGLEAQLEDIKVYIAARKEALLDAMENDRISTSAKILGANVHLRAEVWAGPIDREVDGVLAKDHAALMEALKAEGMDDLLPGTVHSGRYSGYVREQIKRVMAEGADPLLTLDQKIALALPPALAAVTRATEKREVRVTGA